MIRLSTIATKKKKPWKVPNIKKVTIPRHRCERVTSLLDQGLSLYMIAKKTKYPKKQILDIVYHRYDLKDAELTEYNMGTL
jgi:hypothetical protein